MEGSENGFENGLNHFFSQIEDAIFDHFGDTGMKYKNCVRSRVFNLKDSKNAMLRYP